MARFATQSAAPQRPAPKYLTPQIAASSPHGIGPSTTPVANLFVGSDPHMELFNAAVSGMLADGFYESGDERIKRLMMLVPQCNADWLVGFNAWLRDTAGMRSAPIVIAAECVFYKHPAARRIVAEACQRADEPAEMLAYWRQAHGRNVRSVMKRGLSDAMQRLYNERSLLKWDGSGKSWRFGDVIEIVHPIPKGAAQSALYQFALDRRKHNDEIPSFERLPIVHRTLMLEKLPEGKRRSNLAEAGKVMTWERLAGWLPGGMDAEAWTAVIPNMGVMALLRNLNNFEKAKLSKFTAELVAKRLTDAEEIKRSRIFPFRFLTAYENVIDDTYKVALREASELALANLPVLHGDTLIMVDCSGSMSNPAGAGKSSSPLRLSQVAGFMAEALARKVDGKAEIVCYDDTITGRHAPAKGVSVLKASSGTAYRPGGGTKTWTCTRQAYAGQAQVIILTDEQTNYHDSDNGSPSCPVVTWNLAGHKAHHAEHGKQANRLLVAGYNDTAMQILPSLVGGFGQGTWPWEQVG